MTVTLVKRNPPVESAPMGLRAKKRKLTKAAIWDAAIDLFAEKGFDNTTIDEIAAAAWVSRRSFFRYFQSKNDLMAQPIASMANSLAKAVASCPQSAAPADLLRYVVLALARASAAEPRTAKVMEIAAKYPAAREALLSRMAAVQSQIDAAFRRRCKDPFLVQVLCTLTLSTLSLSAQHWLANGQRDIAVSTRKVYSAIAAVVSGLDEPQR